MLLVGGAGLGLGVELSLRLVALECPKFACRSYLAELIHGKFASNCAGLLGVRRGGRQAITKGHENHVHCGPIP